MATLLDYTFADTTVTNPDTTRPAAFTQATVVAGPGSTSLGSYDKALALTATSQAVVDLTGLTPDRTRFCVDVVFSVDALPSATQTLVDCAQLPFTVNVTPGASAGVFAVEARVRPGTGAKAGANSRFHLDLHPGTWYTATLVYDTDTVAVFVDHTIASVHAFPNGALAAATAQNLTIGSTGGGLAHFVGNVAALRWQEDIPAELEAQLDDWRAGAEWHISYKYESLPASLDLGRALTAVAYESAPGAYVQHYDNGLIMCQDGSGVAFEMHGAIWSAYTSLADAGPLGYLVSDEMNSRQAGGRKSLFSQGGVYWSSGTGAVPVIGHLYLDYERLGEASALGFPTQFASAVSGGLEQVFQGARMYWRNGAGAAHEVHGAILDRFLATGSVGAWGFPLTDESDVMSGGHSIGRFNEFEGCTFYWSGATGAHEVHGDIREKYRNLNGPGGQLGFPTSDEADTPGAPAPARFNTFQNGSILWYGSSASITVAQPFQLYFGRLDTVEEEGAFMGQNDLYFRLTVRHGGSTVFDQRFPSSGDFGGHDVFDWDFTVPVTITPNSTDAVSFTLDVWDSDDGAPFGGGDDHLGTWNETLSIADGWGLRTNSGILNSGRFSDINNITASVKPVVDAASLTQAQKWWGVQNQGTDPISYHQYGAAFEDVDEQPEWWDITDWLEKAFYSLVVEDIAKNGNCFGMSLEGINALKGKSLFSLPLDRFTSWGTVSDEFNVKHCYQVGAGPIWWFVGEFLGGNTHDPKAVFQATADAHARGDNPVLCIAQHSDFSGAPHCLMPIGWDTSSNPWVMTLCDPNFPATTRPLHVDPNANTFHYDGGSNVYDGSSTGGGRMHYMPYHLISSPQDTPIWEAIALVLAGLVVILGSDAETQSITDADGNDLDAFGSRAAQTVARKGTLNDYFFSVKGFHAGTQNRAIKATPVGKLGQIHDPGVVIVARPPQDGAIAGELLLRRGRSIRDVVLNRRKPPTIVTHLPVGTLLHSVKSLAPAAAKLAENPAAHAAVAGRTLPGALADKHVVAKLDKDTRSALQAVLATASQQNFVHHVRGKRGGTFEYAIKDGLTEIHVSSPIDEGEVCSLQMTGLGTSKSVLSLAGAKDKAVTIRIEHKLGVGADRIGILLQNIPLAQGSTIELNAKPGLGGVEVVAGGQPANVAVQIDAVIDGRTISNQFSVAMQDGIRLSPASMLTQGTLHVGHIAQLFGPTLNKVLLNPNP